MAGLVSFMVAWRAVAGSAAIMKPQTYERGEIFSSGLSFLFSFATKRHRDTFNRNTMGCPQEPSGTGPNPNNSRTDSLGCHLPTRNYSLDTGHKVSIRRLKRPTKGNEAVRGYGSLAGDS